VLGEFAGDEILEIEPATLVPNGCFLRHVRLLICLSALRRCLP
jgi:hypothetical protein